MHFAWIGSAWREHAPVDNFVDKSGYPVDSLWIVCGNIYEEVYEIPEIFPEILK